MYAVCVIGKLPSSKHDVIGCHFVRYTLHYHKQAKTPESIILNKWSSNMTKSRNIRKHRSIKELEGKKFGMLTVLSEAHGKEARLRRVMNCKCDCGETSLVGLANLVSGRTKTCGCSRPKFTIKNKCPDAGTKFGRLTVVGERARMGGGRHPGKILKGDELKRHLDSVDYDVKNGAIKKPADARRKKRELRLAGKSIPKRRAVTVTCDCNPDEEISVYLNTLLAGQVKSCGCLRDEYRETLKNSSNLKQHSAVTTPHGDNTTPEEVED